MSQAITVVGGGVLGRAVARVLGLGGAAVRVWARRAETRDQLSKELPHAAISDNLKAACKGAAMVFFAVPAPALAEVAAIYGEVATGDQVVVHGARGVGVNFTLPHQILRDETCVRKIAVVGGPLHISELETGRPLAMIVASRFDEAIAAVQLITQNTPVKAHPSRDVVGVEVANAISNVSALAVGMADELGLGETARGLLLTHGLSEAARLGAALGALPSTFAGLAGVGDMIPRRVTSTHRHHQVGQLIVADTTLEDALALAEGTVEGVTTAKEAAALAKTLKLDLPLIQAIDDILHQRAEAKPRLEAVLRRDLDLGRWLAAR
jgi:glycerol-3-phosphate dehydrogenase (NAD(P)+)